MVREGVKVDFETMWLSASLYNDWIKPPSNVIDMAPS